MNLLPQDRMNIEDDIYDVYQPQNILFNITWINLNCGTCTLDRDTWPSYLDTETCIQGHVLSRSGKAGLGSISSGTFWAFGESVAHELGHSIGLLHTHRNDTTATGYTDELVTRVIEADPNIPCSCNCLSTGDRICDTPPDPRYTYTPDLTPEELSAAVQHNIDMFDGDDNSVVCGELSNDNNLDDGCGGVYSDPLGLVMNNVMSYHCDEQNGAPRLSKGQNHMIRMKRDNGDGTFEFQYDPSEMPFTQGLTVNSSTTKDSDEAFNGDIIVNSTLRIENCTIELTEGHKIIVNQGAKLIVKNATIRTYTGGMCYFPMEGKEEWEGIEVVLQDGAFSEVRIFENSTIEKSENGIYNPEGTEGRVHLSMIQSILNGPAINLSNNTGLFTLSSCDFDHTVYSTNNRSLSVNGCNFIFPDESVESGILA
ncbi:MAG: hypothetical protein ACI86M_003549, partial [Saprospiraceae bacterium]